MNGCKASTHILTKDSHNTANFIPYSSRLVCGFLNVPQEVMNIDDICDTGPTVYSPYPRRIESLTICGCNCKGSTFSSVIFETLSVGPAGIELTTSRGSTNSATGTRWWCITELKHARFWDADRNRKRTFRVPGQRCLPDFYIIISNGEKIRSNENVVVWRQVKRENSSLPVSVRVSKTCFLKLPNNNIMLRV